MSNKKYFWLKLKEDFFEEKQSMDSEEIDELIKYLNCECTLDKNYESVKKFKNAIKKFKNRRSYKV